MIYLFGFILATAETHQPDRKKIASMSPRLKPLLLPQLVEERRRRESLSDSEVDLASSSFNTQNSSASELPSPVTPTFSARGHFRYPSSNSSIESAYHTSTDSPSSPTLIASKSSKRSLPDVQEEPQERDEASDMFDGADELYNCLCDGPYCLHQTTSMAQSSVQLSTGQEFDYDMADGFFSDGEFTQSPRSKKRRAIDTPLLGLATRFGTRFPSLSRKWNARRGASSTSVASDAQRETAASRATSSRSSSISNSARQAAESTYEVPLPPTPTRSIFGGREEMSTTSPMPIDIEKANRDSEERGETFATTPLLPPLMIDAAANLREVSMQSPLQSPSVADVRDSLSGTATPIDAITTPQFAGIPSPPLSNKPSINSFHRATSSRPGHLVPSSEIPPILIADPSDEWAIKLGHANFTIHPEPYLPESFDVEACRQLRADWDLARCNYTKHLVRTGEHYGVTSQTYRLTEEKWASTDESWRKNNEITIANTAENGSDAFATLRHTTLQDPYNHNVMSKIPSLNDLRSGGKFPQLGDEDIVGPMVQVAAQLQRTPSKKAKLFKFIADKFPMNLGRP